MSDKLLAHCTACGAYTFPAGAYGCRQCGSMQIEAAALPQTPVLRNFITVHGDVAPRLTPPFVVGEVQLAPGVVEEAVLAVDDESALRLGMPLEMLITEQGVRFRPQGAAT
ncbi:MAG: hypothetical protein Tsb007_34230 [Rhizobacter sp.]